MAPLPEYRPDIARQAAHVLLDSVSLALSDDDGIGHHTAIQRLYDIEALRIVDGEVDASALILAATYLVRLTIEGCTEDEIQHDVVLLALRGTLDTAFPETLEGPAAAS